MARYQHNQQIIARAYPGSREWSAAAEAKRRSERLSSGDRTALRGLEDEIRTLDNPLTTSLEAAKLASEAYSGWFATTRGRLGENLPDWALPDVIADPKTAEATMRLNQILSSEAVNAMSQTLKGASTESEMQKLLEIIADPAAACRAGRRQTLRQTLRRRWIPLKPRCGAGASRHD